MALAAEPRPCRWVQLDVALNKLSALQEAVHAIDTLCSPMPMCRGCVLLLASYFIQAALKWVAFGAVAEHHELRSKHTDMLHAALQRSDSCAAGGCVCG